MILNLENKAQWDAFINMLPKDKQDIYYSYDYYKLHNIYGDGSPECFVYKSDGNIALYPFLKKSINEIGYNLNKEYYDIEGAYGYNGLLSSTDNQEFIRKFFNEFLKYCKESYIVAEFTRFNPYIANYHLSADYMDIYFDRKTVGIDLNSKIEDIYSNFSSSTRRGIQKALKNDFEVIIYKNNYPDKESFIDLYAETMTRVNSSQYLFFNEYYFNFLFECIKPYHIQVYLKDTPIAAAICFCSDNYFHYHLGASKTDYLNLRPNNILFYEMIKLAKANGNNMLHFGGGATKSEDDSLLRFKLGFSKRTFDFFIGKKIHNNEIYNDVIRQWKIKNPEGYNSKKDMLLGYRQNAEK